MAKRMATHVIVGANGCERSPGMGSQIVAAALFGATMLTSVDVSAQDVTTTAQTAEMLPWTPADGARALPPGVIAPACFIQSVPSATAARTADSGTDQLKTVLASCSGTGVVLGEANRFGYYYNPATGAVVVNLERAGATRVMLLQRDQSGTTVEDISGDLSLAVGRTPTGGLSGVAVDFSGFGRDGAIALADQAADAQRGLQQARAFTLADHNTRRQEIAAAAQTTDGGGAQ